MPVIFDQVVARVEPDATPPVEPLQAGSQRVEVCLEEIRYQLGELMQRAARLRAD